MSSERYDWGLKEAAEIVEFLAKSDNKCDWGFKETIDNAIEVVDAEEKAQQERDAAEKARLEKARHKAMMARDKVIIPLLSDLRDDFAADEKGVLPQWHVQSDEDTDIFSGAAVTPNLDASGATCFVIKAEASVAERNDFVTLSVVCSLVDSKSTSANQLAPLYSKTVKFAVLQKFDELGNRMWLHQQLAECARMCVLTRMRQLPTRDANHVPTGLVNA